ncbi:MAG: hypothetical protein PHF18_04600 [Methanosarcina sp.]|uniref:tetratricopeptide repeat protein n=1 Tax=Methanosarcina sp. TaxID=2213 RepID=UPI00262D5DBD|nr:hypothetical protein [Methanosarcina sp.]MDD3246126.1 hypothetical protein [Methanosarcina sp.]
MSYCFYCGGDHPPGYCPLQAQDQSIKSLSNQTSTLEKIGHLNVSAIEENGKLVSSEIENIVTNMRSSETAISEGFENLLNEISNNHYAIMRKMERNIEVLTGICELFKNSLYIEYLQRYNEAVNNFRDGRLMKCLETLEKAEYLKSDDYRIYLLRGHTYVRLDKLEKALESFEEASMITVSNKIEVNDSHKGYCLYLISRVYFCMENIETAIKKIRESLKLVNDPVYNYQYAAFLAYRQPKLLKE